MMCMECGERLGTPEITDVFLAAMIGEGPVLCKECREAEESDDEEPKTETKE